MNRTGIALFAALALALAGGCATKNYGRIEAGAADGSCADVAAGLADVTQFRAEVARRSAFGPEDVLALLIDFGIGNLIAKQAALKSADARAAELEARQRELACPTQVTAGRRD